jgi:hypothetical protein
MRLSDDHFVAIANDLRSGKSTVEVGKKHGISRHCAYRIKKAIARVLAAKSAQAKVA